jgi:Ubiquitin 3 binding protein But2 C-terminal domain
MKATLALALAATTSAAAIPAALQKRDDCPTDLNGDYAAPALIVPVDSANPENAAGTQYLGTVSKTVDTLFQFNIPSTYSGKTCSLIMLLPSTPNVQQFSGDGILHTTLLQNQVSTSTTWNTKGPVSTDHGNVTVVEGNSYTLATFDCPAGYQLTYDVGSADGNTELTWFETSQDPATGLWVRAC